MKERVAFHTLGCRLNFAESGTLASMFEKNGHKIVPFGDPAELIIINTCSVTNNADATCRNVIKKAYKHNPEAKTVVIGCYAQMEPELLSKMNGVDLVIGSSEKHKILDYLAEEQGQIIHIDRSNEFWGAATTKASNQTRAFLKIQDGCNYICSYCIIPFARGRSRATSTENSFLEAKRVISNGFKELVLTGVNIGEYQSNSGERLTTLISKILEIPNLKRLRLSSIEPNTITDELLELAKNHSKFIPHFHIPLQSGSDVILKQMKRKYTSSAYKDTIYKIKSTIPDAIIGTDVIVGFPGESEELFNITYDFLNDLPITHFHIFPYSRRKGTIASKLSGHIPHKLKKQRAKKLIELGDRKLKDYSKSKIGTKIEVLFEQRNKDGFFEGYSREFLKVKMASKENLNNQIKNVLIKSLNESNELLA